MTDYEALAAELKLKCSRHPSKPHNGYGSGWQDCKCHYCKAAAAIRELHHLALHPVIVPPAAARALLAAQAANERLRAALVKMKKYGNHKVSCALWSFRREFAERKGETCTCGLDDLLKP